MPKHEWRWVLWVLLALGLGAGLLWLLVRYGNLSQADLRLILNVSPLYFLGLFVIVSMQFVLSTYKWWLASSRLSHERLTRADYFNYLRITVTGGVVGLLVPMYLGTLFVRGAGLRIQQRERFRSGLVSSVYEQGFDFLIPICMLGPSIFYALGRLTPGQWWSWSLGFLVVGGALTTLWTGALLRFAAALVVRPWFPLPERVQVATQTLSTSTLWDRQTLLMIFTISLVRYINLAVYSLLVVWSVGLGISVFHIIVVLPLATLSIFLAITPGNLGVTEWAWASQLVLLGNDPDIAAMFSIANRLFVVISLLIFFFLVQLIGRTPQYERGSLR